MHQPTPPSNFSYAQKVMPSPSRKIKWLKNFFQKTMLSKTKNGHNVANRVPLTIGREAEMDNSDLTIDLGSKKQNKKLRSRVALINYTS